MMTLSVPVSTSWFRELSVCVECSSLWTLWIELLIHDANGAFAVLVFWTSGRISWNTWNGNKRIESWWVIEIAQTSCCSMLTLFNKTSRLKRKGNSRLFNERWLPMLEFASSLFCSTVFVEAGTFVVDATTAVLGDWLFRFIVINVSLLLGVLALNTGSGFDIACLVSTNIA